MNSSTTGGNHPQESGGIPSPVSSTWDVLDEKNRTEYLLTLADRQRAYLREHVEFYDHPLYNTVIRELEDLEAIPLLGGATARREKTTNLYPAETAVYTSHGTGGTTGDSLNVVDSPYSWETSVGRMAGVVEDVTGKQVLNAYNGTHITSPLLNDVVRALGAEPFKRALTDDEDASQLIERMADLDCSMLIAPGTTPDSNKGASVTDIWNADEDGYLLENVDRVWYSSTPMDDGVLTALQRSGITVESFFGNTEVRAFGYAPPAHPKTFHILEGQYMVVGLDETGDIQRAGDDVRLLVSAVSTARPASRRIPADCQAYFTDLEKHGEIGPHDGTGFFLYETGDKATINEAGPCPYSDECSLTTRTLDDIERVERFEEKESSGCQIG